MRTCVHKYVCMYVCVSVVRKERAITRSTIETVRLVIKWKTMSVIFVISRFLQILHTFLVFFFSILLCLFKMQ